MAICSFYQEGRCRYGSNCRFEHPRDQAQQSYQSSNRFGALSSGGFSRGGGGGGRVDSYRPGDNRDQVPKFQLTREGIEADFTTERPIWPMSCYGPGKDAPRQLIEGPEYEISPEEVRVLFYQARASGDPAQLEQYNQNEQAASTKAHTAGQEIANNPDRFIQTVLSAENQHPNRIDQTVKPSGSWQRPQGTVGASNALSTSGARPSPFGATNQQNTTSAFGAAGGQTASGGFGAPSPLGGGAAAFGKPSMPGNNTTAFGQASQRPAFGSASALGGASTPAFGAASQPSSTGFGQASALGNRQSPFATNQAAPSTGFGFGAANNTQSQQSTSFGQNSQTTQPSPFAQNNANPQQPSPFGQASSANQQSSPFGQANAANQQSSPFGHVNGNSQPKASPFGQPSNTTQQQASPFGQNSNTGQQFQGNPFGQSNSTAQQVSSPFGQQNATNQQPPTSAFGQPSTVQQRPTTAFGQASTTTNGAFGGQPAQPAPSPFARVNGAANVSNMANSNPNVPIQSWKGKPVTYVKTKNKAATNVPTIKNETGRPQRIWHPHGPPNPLPDQAQGPAESYAGDLGAMLKEAYEFVAQNGQFKGGIMPEIPPKNEWVLWDV